MAESTDQRAIEFAKCAADCDYFTDQYLIIDDAQGHGGGTGQMPFKLWAAQVPVMWTLMRGGLGGQNNPDRLVIILKARQLGISWLCCGYGLWRCLFQPGQLVLLFSIGQSESNEMLRRLKVLYERLPDWMKEALPSVEGNSLESLSFGNGSRVQPKPATKTAGRSLTASLVILDEAAFQAWAEDLYAALKPTIDGGGQLIILSTANGIGNLFHRLWTASIEGGNGFKTIFLPWWSRPGRDAAWYARQQREYTDPKKVKQEYPGSANEAFLVSGRVRFQPEWIEAQTPNVETSLPITVWPEQIQTIPDGLTIYRLPERGRRYLISADVAEGVDGGDFSTAPVIDLDTWEEVACIHGLWEPDEFARRLLLLSDVYGADIVVERNNHGHSVLATLKHLRCRRIENGHDDKPGWLTNAQTKGQSIDMLAQSLRDTLVTIRSQATLNELQIYRILKDGGTGAPQGYHDDRVMSWAIALMVARRPQTNRAQSGRARVHTATQFG